LQTGTGDGAGICIDGGDYMINIEPERRDEIRARCRAWRIANRYPMTRIAELAGVSRQAVKCFETKTGMSRRMLEAYIALGMPLSDIIEASGIDIISAMEDQNDG